MVNERQIRRIINTKQDSIDSDENISLRNMSEGQISISKSLNKQIAIHRKKYGQIWKSYMSADGNQYVDRNLNVANNIIIKGDLDVDGLANLDGVDIDGNVQLDGTFTVGTDGSGQDVTFYSGTSGDSFVWDASEEKLTITGTNGQTALDIADGNLVVADNIDVEGDLDVNGTTNLDDVDIDGNVDINGTISASAIYQHTGNTDTNITFATNSIGFYQAHANAGGEASLRINSEGVIVNPVGEAGIDFRVESDGVVKCLYVDSTYNSVQIGGGSALQGSPSGGMFIHNGTTPGVHTDDTVYIGAKDTTVTTSNDGSTLSVFCEAGVDSSGTPSNLNNFNAKIAVYINGNEYWLWLQDPSP